MSGGPVERRQWCPECDGEGSVWMVQCEDGFERNRRWGTCETCEGKGYLPETEKDEDNEQD